MAKVLRCDEFVPGCPFEARGASEEEVLMQAADHGKTAHGMTEMPLEMVSKVRAAIRDEEQASGQAAGS
jgi:predicted small metal-binding protein